MKSTVEILSEAREFLSDHARRCTGNMAKDVHGNVLAELDPAVTQCCLLGAIRRAARGQANAILDDVLPILEKYTGLSRYDYGTADLADRCPEQWDQILTEAIALASV